MRLVLVACREEREPNRSRGLVDGMSALSVVAGFSLAQGAVKLRRRGLGGDKDSWRTP